MGIIIEIKVIANSKREEVVSGSPLTVRVKERAEPDSCCFKAP